MRNLLLLEIYRDKSRGVIAHYGDVGDDTCGVFQVPSPVDGKVLRVVAAAGEGWDHVSVSRPDRCPDWREMEHVKRLFFCDHETAMQLHVPPAEHIDVCKTCLHLWRPHGAAIPRPPAWMVA